MADQKEDTIAARRNSLAALIRSFAWPAVTVGAIVYFGSSLKSLLTSSQRLSAFGVEIELWQSTARLSDAQLQQLAELSPEEILDFATGLGRGNQWCLTTPPSANSREATLIEIGLVESLEGDCFGDNDGFLIAATLEGRRLGSALEDTLKALITDQLNAGGN